MAVTNTLQRVLSVAQLYNRQAPLTFPALSAPNDLAFLAGDWVRQFILSPPFAWRWNRSSNTFATVSGQQDYTLSIDQVAGHVTGFAVATGGLGYNNGDVITVVQGGGSGCQMSVQIGSGGTVLAMVEVSGGTGYSLANNLATTGGSGTGLTVNILNIGAASTFGWLEKASLTDNTGSSPVVTELTVQLVIGEESVKNQPQFIATQLDNGAGLLTFRLSPPPDKVYSVTLTSQNAPSNFANLTDTWAPIPDYMSYLYTQGFFAKGYEYMENERWGSTMQLFIKQLVAANDGLDDTQVNIFLSQRLDLQREQSSVLERSQLGTRGRALA